MSLDELIRRYQAVYARWQANNAELLGVLEERSLRRIAGRPEVPALLERTKALTRAVLECHRDLLRLRADVIEYRLADKTAGADSLRGLTIPDFMPEEL